jgi:hypothetical protein
MRTAAIISIILFMYLLLISISFDQTPAINRGSIGRLPRILWWPSSLNIRSSIALWDPFMRKIIDPIGTKALL